MTEKPLVVGLGGTMREHSSSERVLRLALAAAERAGAETLLFSAADIDLPMYVPDQGDRPENARRLVDGFARADGVLLSSPGYHGGLSGLIKNALDYIEDLRTAQRPYLDGRAVGCIACAFGWQAAVTTLVELRSVVHALRGWPTPLGVAINSAEPLFDDDGSLVNDRVRDQLQVVGSQVVEFARWRSGASG